MRDGYRVAMTARTASRDPRLVLAAMTLANAMILVDQTAVPLTLPDLLQDFHIGTEKAQWVLNASLLSLTCLLVLGGRLADMFGRKRVFLIGIVLFTGASAVGGLAPDYPVLIVARVVQGAGGALVLPATVAIVSAAYSADQRGRALGTMGGAAAVAGALGPTIGGVLTSAFSWRAVLLVNVPLAVACVLIARRGVPADAPASTRGRIDTWGAGLLGLFLVGLVLGLSNTQTDGWGSQGVVLPLAICLVAGVLLVIRETKTSDPLIDFALLRRNRNYLGATISQGLGGMVEMGTGVLFPLLLILNLEMAPSLAGLALIPATIPMVLGAPLAGRWYDRMGGRPPLAVGFGILGLSGLALAWGVQENTYLAILPGLLIYGVGLALVLTVNDPVTLDMLPESTHGQASGVSATAEQGGGAIGIAILYSIFHSAYVSQLHENIDRGPLANLTDAQYERLRAGLIAAEQTGLRPENFDRNLKEYLRPARAASEHGYSVAFIAVALIGAIGAIATWLLVRRPDDLGGAD